jgi:hypothetical protein
MILLNDCQKSLLVYFNPLHPDYQNISLVEYSMRDVCEDLEELMNWRCLVNGITRDSGDPRVITFRGLWLLYLVNTGVI